VLTNINEKISYFKLPPCSEFCMLSSVLNFICRHFGTLCLFHLHRHDRTECSETSEYKIQTSGNYPEESVQQLKDYSIKSEHNK